MVGVGVARGVLRGVPGVRCPPGIGLSIFSPGPKDTANTHLTSQ